MKIFQLFFRALFFCLIFNSTSFAKDKPPTPPPGPVKFECPFKVGAAVLHWNNPNGGVPFVILPIWEGPNDDDPVIYKWGDFNSKGEPVPTAFVECYREVEGPNDPGVKFSLPNEVRFCQINKRGKDHRGRFWCK